MENVTNGLPRLRAIRKVAGLTQEELARRVACFRETISRIESGKQDPSMGLIRKLARALGCELRDLVGEAVLTPTETEGAA